MASRKQNGWKDNSVSGEKMSLKPFTPIIKLIVIALACFIIALIGTFEEIQKALKEEEK